MKTYSLLRRITVGLTATILLAGLASFGWLYIKVWWTDIVLREQSLFDQATVISKYLSSNANNRITLTLPSRLAEAYSSPESEYRYAVRDESGQYLFDSGTAVSALPNFSHGLRTVYDYDPDGAGPLRVFGAALRTKIGNRTVVVQVEQKTIDPQYLKMAVVDEFITDGGWLVIPLLLVLLGVSIWIVKRALAPITRISALAETIGPANANIRLSIDQVPREILPLVQSINAALDRLDHGLQQQREFNANAAHQLRTPLSVLLANVDTLNDKKIANTLRPEIEHMSRIISQLLLVARLETFAVNLNETVDLNDTAAEISAGLAPLALASNKSIELVRNNSSVLVRTNIFAIRSALGNLIENAIRHTPEGTSVRLRVTGHPSIEVEDCGPGIPVEQRMKIFERFWRGDKSGGGAGLGLAIVDRIMKGLQGSVSVGTAPSGGALFTLTFPRTAMGRIKSEVQ